MGFFEGFFGNTTKEERNEGGDFIAIPRKAPGEVSDQESIFVEEKRKKIEELERKIVMIEGNPEHPEYSELAKLRDKLRELNG